MSTPPLTPQSSSFFTEKVVAMPTGAGDPTGSLLSFFLSPNLDLSNVSGALEEYVFRSISRNRRVRDWCADVVDVIGLIRSQHVVRQALSLPPLSILYPFIVIPLNNYIPPYTLFIEPSLLSATSLSCITRKQLIESLVKLSRNKRLIEGDDTGVDVLVLEVCLEYIGRRWREGELSGAVGVDEIGKKLVEVEMEVQLHGHPSTVIDHIIPSIRRIRFQLGFVPASQLHVPLATVESSSMRRAATALDPYQVSMAWLSCRLRGGIEPKRSLSELTALEDCSSNRNKACNDPVSTLLTELGLKRSKDFAGTRSSAGPYSPFPPTPSASTTSLSSTIKNIRSVSLGSTKSPTRRTVADDAGWWCHRRNKSSFSKLHLPIFHSERRPSLPAISSPSVIMSTAIENYSPPATAWMQTPEISPKTTPRQSMTNSYLEVCANNSLSTILTFSAPEDMRTILIDHLLVMRYRLGKRPEDDWFLGNGKRLANEAISTIEAKSLKRKDSSGLKAIFNDLRAVFHLSPPSIVESLHHWAAQHEILEDFPEVPEREAASPFIYRERDASFDLDQYLEDISCDAANESLKEENIRSPRRKSAGADSVFTMHTSGTTSRMTHRTSLLSSFTIREATREWHAETRAVAYHVPRKVKSLEAFHLEEEHDINDEHVGEVCGTPTNYGHWSRVTEDLDSLYTRLPPKVGSFRRRKRTSTLSTSFSASELGQAYHHPIALYNPPVQAEYGFEPYFETPGQLDVTMLDLPLSPPATDICPSRPQISDEYRSRRKAYRHFAIFDGEQYSPSRDPLASTGSPIPKFRVPPRMSSLKQISRFPVSPPSPIASLMSLFETDHGSMRPHPSLTGVDVERILSATVLGEIAQLEAQGQAWDDEAKGRMAWLLRQAEDMVCSAQEP